VALGPGRLRLGLDRSLEHASFEASLGTKKRKAMKVFTIPLSDFVEFFKSLFIFRVFELIVRREKRGYFPRIYLFRGDLIGMGVSGLWHAMYESKPFLRGWQCVIREFYGSLHFVSNWSEESIGRS
jgi:hypothetical protein